MVLFQEAATGMHASGGDADRLGAALAPLRDAGVLALALAPKHGGSGASMSRLCDTVRRAARVDGSLGFMLSQAALGHMVTAGFGGEVLGAMHRTRPATVAGVFAPKGRARRVVDGWRVSGRWPLATGAILADYVYLQCLATDGRRVITGPWGAPLPALAILPAAHVRIERTWNAVGLVATASDTVVAEDAAVAEPWLGTLIPTAEQRIAGVPVHRFDAADMAGLPIAAVALGIAEALLEAVAGLGRSARRAAFESAALADAPAARREMGIAAMQIEAAAAVLDRAASGGFGQDRAGRARTQAATATVVRLCGEAAVLLQALAGSDALPRDGTIARGLADLGTLSLHAWAHANRTAPLGAVLLGGDVDPALLPLDPSGGDQREGMGRGQKPPPLKA